MGAGWIAPGAAPDAGGGEGSDASPPSAAPGASPAPAAPAGNDPWAVKGIEDAGAAAAPQGNTPEPGADPWAVQGIEDASPALAVRAHQDPNKNPVENTRSLYQRTKAVLFGHEPDSPQDPDQSYSPGIVPAIRDSATEEGGLFAGRTPGPDWSTMVNAYPKVVKAQLTKVAAGLQEGVGAQETTDAEAKLAALNVLPQVAARYTKTPGGLADIDSMAKDLLVSKTARKLGMDPRVFAGMWSNYAGQNDEQRADTMHDALDTLNAGRKNLVAGQGKRNQAWADERVWQPSDLAGGKLDPWSIKGVAFNAATAVPQLLATVGATLAGTAVAGPGGGVAAGGATAAALFAPAQREDAANAIDEKAHKLLEKADEIERMIIDGEPGLNPVAHELRQQAADLTANRDKIANTAGLLYAVGDAAGALPISAVLARAPGAQAVMNRIVGSAIGKTAGGRIAGAAVANGAGGMIQAAIQKAVDAGIVHEDTTIADAMKDIALSGITAAVTAAPIAAMHEGAGIPGRNRARRDLEHEDLYQQAQAASDAMGAKAGRNPPRPGESPDYPGYAFDEASGKYYPYGQKPGEQPAPPNAPKIEGPAGTESGQAGTEAPKPGAPGPVPGETGPEPGTPAARRAEHAAKVNALNEAAAGAEKRSDITLEPEEEGWSVHVKGEQVAKFDNAANAREAMAQARKLVGTKPPGASPSAQSPAPAAEAPAGKVSPETVAEAAPAPAQSDRRAGRESAPERREDTAQRKAVAEMNPEELRAALLTHEKSGIPNNRAYQEAAKKPAQVSVDLDSLKAVNDTAGHGAGDMLIKAAAQALHEASGGNAYHVGGDEFVVQADHEDHADEIMSAARERMRDATIEVQMPDGRTFSLKGVGVSYGVGKDLHEADHALNAEKQYRTEQGLRSPRGELPKGASLRAGEPGGQSGGGQAPTSKVLGQEVEHPDQPTPAQATAGNYFKPTVQWQGLPIKIENKAGSFRSGVSESGKKWRSKMHADYGYISGTHAKDGDAVDVFMGKNPESTKAYVIDQTTPDGRKYDEAKSVVGVDSLEEARELYLKHYPKDWKGLGAITEMPVEKLKAWAQSPGAKKPIAWVPPPKTLAEHLDSPNTVARMLEMVHEAGWDQVGGQVQRTLVKERGNEYQTTRTKWIPKAPWFQALSERLPEKAPRQYAEALQAALAGEKLSALEQRVLTEMGHFAATQLPGKYDWRAPLSDEQLEALTPEQYDVRLARLEAEEERLGKLDADQFPTESAEPDIPFSRPDDFSLTAPKGTVATDKKPEQPATQGDLFGDRVAVANEIARMKAAKDKKRSSGQTSVETGKPGDLFSAATQQTEIPGATTRLPTKAPESARRVKGKGKPVVMGPESVEQPERTLTDAGEKIGGARKDQWKERGMALSDLSSMTDSEAAGLVTKHAIWKPDYEQMISDGRNSAAVALIKVLWDKLAARPRVNTPQGRADYVEAMRAVADHLGGAYEVDQVRKVDDALTGAVGYERGRGMGMFAESEGRRKYWSIMKGRRSAFPPLGNDVRAAAKLLESGWPNAAPWRSRLEIRPGNKYWIPP